MNGDSYYKLAEQQPIELAQRLALDKAACSLAKASETVSDFIALLAQAGQLQAALAVLAHTLPKREAVWWSCVAVRFADPPIEGSDADNAIKAAERWVYHPTEETRQPIGAAAAKAGLGTPAGWAAMAAFWSGGSLAPPDMPIVPPADDLTAKAVTGATTLAGMQPDPNCASTHFIAFIRMALDIARGGDGRHLSA